MRLCGFKSHLLHLKVGGLNCEGFRLFLFLNICNYSFPGKAFEKFKELVARQGGDVSFIEDPSKFEKAPIITPVIAEDDGVVEKLDAGMVGKAGLGLGMGRQNKDDEIDPRVGMIFNKKIGDDVKKGDVLFYLEEGKSEEYKALEDQIEQAEIAYKQALLGDNVSQTVYNNLQNGVTADMTAYQNSVQSLKNNVSQIEKAIEDLTTQRANLEATLITIGGAGKDLATAQAEAEAKKAAEKKENGKA